MVPVCVLLWLLCRSRFIERVWIVPPAVVALLGPAHLVTLGLHVGDPHQTLALGLTIIGGLQLVEAVWRPDPAGAWMYISLTLVVGCIVSTFAAYLLHSVRRRAFWQSLVINWQMG
jgi:hypothetical protein